jgi:hypothetical protein
LFPVEDPDLRAAIRDHVLFLHFADNVKSRLLLRDGTYVGIEPAAGERAIDSQLELLTREAPWRAVD